jgi:hypothetical protein
MDENTILILAAAAIGFYFWYRNQNASSTTTTTPPATGTPVNVSTPSAPTSPIVSTQAPYPVSITAQSSCNPTYPSMAYALISAVGATGFTLMTGPQWDALMSSALLQTGIAGTATAAEMAAQMTACDYVNLRQMYGALTSVAIYQPSNSATPAVVVLTPAGQLPGTPGKVYAL